MLKAHLLQRLQIAVLGINTGEQTSSTLLLALELLLREEEGTARAPSDARRKMPRKSLTSSVVVSSLKSTKQHNPLSMKLQDENELHFAARANLG